jgi:squalene-hopene/tetraprenyl-beta-curcumene cyclase
MTSFRHSVAGLPTLVAGGLLLFAAAVGGQQTSPSDRPGGVENDDALLEDTVRSGVAFLKTFGQAADGSFSASAGPAVTALAATALLRNGLTPDDPAVAKALEYLLRFKQPDGGIYQEGSRYRNYETCLAILCLTEANREHRYDQVLDEADRFIRGLQWDEGEGHDISSTHYGGAGYGGHSRPDLSNTSFLIDALRAAGRGPEDEALKKALVFVSRCQNLESPHNTTPYSSKNPDGGFYYTPASGGVSQAGNTPEGGLRSYASMTYAGLKSMIYAGVDRDDPRVQAAVEWIRRNFDLTTNPGMGSAGLYYYYHTFAKALSAWQENSLTDQRGAKHDWRRELVEELARRQQPNGSWVNENNRWLESDANLVTSYALLALSYCRQE